MRRARLVALAGVLVVAVSAAGLAARAVTCARARPAAAAVAASGGAPAAAVAGGIATGARVTPASAARGATVTVAVAVRSQAAMTVLVDLEVADPAGRKLFQRSWDGQALEAGRTRRLQAAWKVPAGANPGAHLVRVGVFTRGWGTLLAWNGAAAHLSVRRAAAATTTTTAAPAPATSLGAGGAPARFGTLPPGSALPSGARCAAWVRAGPLPEVKGVNRAANQRAGQHLGAGFFDPRSTDPRAAALAARVDGAFTGTTEQVLRWAACKWGVDEDLVRAQAAVESWWRQTTLGDWAGDAAACPPGHGLGADGRAGQCPQSYGILQNRYPYERSSWPGIEQSTAMNADTAYAIWRACYEGYEGWLNDVERGRQYGPGDALGCMGRWFAGRWHTAAADQYVAKVKDYLARRVWLTPAFREP